jgi:mannose-6-phosphate isomerase-like protein (cupin superfamily)
MGWPHQFQVRALRMEPLARSSRHARLEEEVILMHRGALRLEWAGGWLDLAAGDTLTVPQSLERTFVNPGREASVAYVVRGGDHPRAAVLA